MVKQIPFLKQFRWAQALLLLGVSGMAFYTASRQADEFIAVIGVMVFGWALESVFVAVYPDGNARGFTLLSMAISVAGMFWYFGKTGQSLFGYVGAAMLLVMLALAIVIIRSEKT